MANVAGRSGRTSSTMTAGADRAHPTPGKRTQIEQLPRGPGGDGSQVHAAAAAGVAAPATTLPFRDHIQRLFGRHDISQVQAHTGGAADASARTMGAQAYATGDHVVLGAHADLHTVAHEAAHVVQQRGGVHLTGGVGAAGDTYERHADAVADAVVAGRSAEALLDQVATPRAGAASAGAVQRKLVERGAVVTEQDLSERCQAPSPIVRQLFASREEFYVAQDVDYAADSIDVLEKKKYILGETHGDGTFEDRTEPWPDVPRIVEQVKAFSGSSAPERNAIQAAEVNQPGNYTKDGLLPLESIHAYALARVLMFQQKLNLFKGAAGAFPRAPARRRTSGASPWSGETRQLHFTSDVPGRSGARDDKGKGKEIDADADADADFDVHELGIIDTEESLRTELDQEHGALIASAQEDHDELVRCLSSYTRATTALGKEIGLSSCQPSSSQPSSSQPSSSQPSSSQAPSASCTRAPVYYAITMSLDRVMRAGDPITWAHTSAAQRDELQRILQEVAQNIMILLDDRPEGPFGIKWGSDPIPNRKALSAFARPGAEGDPEGALRAADPVREAAMIKHATQAGAPLFVQVGNNHVRRLAAAIPDAVPVYKDDDFTRLTRRSATTD